MDPTEQVPSLDQVNQCHSELHCHVQQLENQTLCNTRRAKVTSMSTGDINVNTVMTEVDAMIMIDDNTSLATTMRPSHAVCACVGGVGGRTSPLPGGH